MPLALFYVHFTLTYLVQIFTAIKHQEKETANENMPQKNTKEVKKIITKVPLRILIKIAFGSFAELVSVLRSFKMITSC